MQNSILMKDTQLFLMEVCLCWLSSFHLSFKYIIWLGRMLLGRVLCQEHAGQWRIDGLGSQWWSTSGKKRGNENLGLLLWSWPCYSLRAKVNVMVSPLIKITGKSCKSCGWTSTPWCWLVLKQQGWSSRPETEVAISTCLVKLVTRGIIQMLWQPWHEAQGGQTCVCTIQTYRWAMARSGTARSFFPVLSCLSWLLELAECICFKCWGCCCAALS